MQLISEAYDVLKTVGGLTNDELVEAFNEWNKVRGQTYPDPQRNCMCYKQIAWLGRYFSAEGHRRCLISCNICI
jgi:hypothetical protein